MHKCTAMSCNQDGAHSCLVEGGLLQSRQPCPALISAWAIRVLTTLAQANPASIKMCIAAHGGAAHTAMPMKTPRRKLSRKNPSIGERSIPPSAGMIPRNRPKKGSVSWKVLVSVEGGRSGGRGPCEPAHRAIHGGGRRQGLVAGFEQPSHRAAPSPPRRSPHLPHPARPDRPAAAC